MVVVVVMVVVMGVVVVAETHMLHSCLSDPKTWLLARYWRTLLHQNVVSKILNKYCLGQHL